MPVQRRPIRARISPQIRLHRIVITLDEFEPPKVELHGKIATGKRPIDQASAAMITTRYLGDTGAAFIEEIKADFGTAASEKIKENATNG